MRPVRPLGSSPHFPVLSGVVGISTRDPLSPNRFGCHELPSDLHSPPGSYPLGIVALSRTRARGAYSSERPDRPSLPARTAFYDTRERINVPDSLPSVKPAVP